MRDAREQFAPHEVLDVIVEQERLGRAQRASDSHALDDVFTDPDLLD
jgi:hypothetical protein